MRIVISLVVIALVLLLAGLNYDRFPCTGLGWPGKWQADTTSGAVQQASDAVERSNREVRRLMREAGRLSTE